MSSELLRNDLLDFYITDLKNKLTFLDGHLNRMWTRFNFFLTIESALFVLLFKPPDGVSLRQHAVTIVPVGLVLCLLWYLFGREDRYQVALQRRLVEGTVGEIKRRLGLEEYYYPGQTDGMNSEDLPPANLTQGRIPALSITKLAAIFPLALVAIWVAVFVAIR